MLADGSLVRFNVHDATVLWDGQPVRVYAHLSETTPLVGMRMLHRHNLNIDVEEGGSVVIQAGE